MIRTCTVEIECEINGIEGLVTYDVTYEYTPGEPMVRYYADGSGYPGCPPELNVISAKQVSAVKYNGYDSIDVEEQIETDLKIFEDYCWEDMDDYYERYDEDDE